MQFRRAFPTFVLLATLCPVAGAQAQATRFAAANDITWTQPGTNENDSMPLGNGDLALNIWTETNGDIVLLVAKSDAWSENGQLLKLGRVRVKLSPNPFVGPQTFAQTLHMESGEVQISSVNNLVRIWVDANHPVAHFEITSRQPINVEADAEVWRLNKYHLNQK